MNSYFLFTNSWEWHSEAYHNEHIGKVEPIVYGSFRNSRYKSPELLNQLIASLIYMTAWEQTSADIKCDSISVLCGFSSFRYCLFALLFLNQLLGDIHVLTKMNATHIVEIFHRNDGFKLRPANFECHGIIMKHMHYSHYSIPCALTINLLS